MVVDRLLREEQPVGDLDVRGAVGEQTQDVELTHAPSSVGVPRCCACSADDGRLSHPGGRRRRLSSPRDAAVRRPFRGKPQGLCGPARTGLGRGVATLPGMTIMNSTEQVTLVPEGAWEVDPARSTVGFAVRHLKVTKVRGRFSEFTGVIRCDPDGITSIDGKVEVASIETGDRRRDARLRAEDFFDAERHPTIAFNALSEATGSGGFPVVRGMMTVRGVTRPLELHVDAPGSPVAGDGDLRIRATGVLSRREFGLRWDSAFAAGGLVIDDRVALQLDVVLCPRP